MSSRNRIVTICVAAPAAAVLLAACSAATSGTPTAGSCQPVGASQSAVAPTIRCYLHAVSENDTDTACELLSAREQAQVARSGESGWSGVNGPDSTGSGSVDDCSSTMSRTLSRATPEQHAGLRELAQRVRITSISVVGPQASARVSATVHGESATQRLRLVQQSGSWRLDSDSAYSTD